MTAGNTAVKRVAKYALLVALGMVFSYLEMLLPIPLGIPGVKLGLANLVVLVTLAWFGPKEAVAVSLLRVLLVGLTFGHPSSLLYALAGGAASLLAMCLLWKTRSLSIYGVSMAGALAHNFGQLAVALWATSTARLVYYAPILLLSGVITGALMAFLAALLLKRLPNPPRSS